MDSVENKIPTVDYKFVPTVSGRKNYIQIDDSEGGSSSVQISSINRLGKGNTIIEAWSKENPVHLVTIFTIGDQRGLTIYFELAKDAQAFYDFLVKTVFGK